MENRHDDKVHVLYGESVDDVARFLAGTPKVWRASQSRDSGHPPSMFWDLCAGWQGTVKMARDGWSEGAAKLADILNVLMPPNDKETDTRYDVAGHFPDVARYIAGDPACMVRRGRTHGHPPVVNIVIAATASGGVPAVNYANFGAAMTNVIDRIEAGGRRVELSVMFPNNLRGQGGDAIRCLAGWRVKAAEDHCDLSAIAFSIGHPAAYRRFGFGLWEHTSQRYYPGGGYGSCVPFTKDDAAHMNMEECIIVNAEGEKLYKCKTPAKAATFVANAINAAAGEDIVLLEEEV